MYHNLHRINHGFLLTMLGLLLCYGLRQERSLSDNYMPPTIDIEKFCNMLHDKHIYNILPHLIPTFMLSRCTYDDIGSRHASMYVAGSSADNPL